MNKSRIRSELVPPWDTASSADLQAAIAPVITQLVVKHQSRLKIAVESLPSIKQVLIDLLKGDGARRNEAEELLENGGDIEEILNPFLEEQPKWVVRCSVTDSMMSDSWGLKTFYLGSQGFLYYMPVLGVGDDNECLPIIGTWERSNEKGAAFGSLFAAYKDYWQDFALPPAMGQWAQGPVPFLVAAIGAILEENPDSWSDVLDRLRADLSKDSEEGDLLTFLTERVAKVTERENLLVATVLENFLNGRKESPQKFTFRDVEAPVLIAAFVSLIGRSGS
jgi:hypothetical protein